MRAASLIGALAVRKRLSLPSQSRLTDFASKPGKKGIG